MLRDDSSKKFLIKDFGVKADINEKVKFKKEAEIVLGIGTWT